MGVITHAHKGVRHRLFTCPNTCELGDENATPVALEVNRTHRGNTLSPLGRLPEGKPVGRVQTSPGLGVPVAVEHMRGLCNCQHAKDHTTPHAPSCPGYSAPPASEVDARVLTHEVNKHLRTFLALTPEHRTLVANVALALRKGVGE